MFLFSTMFNPLHTTTDEKMKRFFFKHSDSSHYGKFIFIINIIQLQSKSGYLRLYEGSFDSYGLFF